MLLGPGAAADISPDGRWVAAILSDDHDITLLPTGVGQPRTVTNHELHHQDAQWTVDGKALIVKGYRDSESIRFWVEDVDSARTRPITPPGLDGTIARIQGHDYVVTHGTDGQGLLYPIEGQPIPAEGLAATDTVVCGSAREAALFVIPHLGGQDRSIEKVDIESGQRQPFVRLTALGDNAFIAAPRWIHISADEREIVYTQQREMNALFLATGLR
jgi:hypothetical protein